MKKLLALIKMRHVQEGRATREARSIVEQILRVEMESLRGLIEKKEARDAAD
ncbi:MAG: hypothetical protein ACPG61_16665 [Paracoccaceae bacterium]